jgi:DNA-binding NarL/FixJ family response regulator
VIRVLLVDDHSSFREPLAYMLGREPDLEVAGQAGTLAEARRLLRDVDVAVVDLGLPDGDGVDLVRDLCAENPRGQVLVLTGEKSRLDHARAVEAGASGILHKSVRLDDIVEAVKRLGAGVPLLSPHETVDLLRLVSQHRGRDQRERETLGRLTRREQEVLEALALGLSDKEIAERLGVGIETVRTHMVNLFKKLGVESRLQALLFAVRQGVVSVD